METSDVNGAQEGNRTPDLRSTKGENQTLTDNEGQTSQELVKWLMNASKEG